MKTDEQPDHESDDRFRVIVEASPNGVVVADEGSRITMANPRAQKLFGYSRDEFLKLKVEDLVPQDVRPGHEAKRSAYHAHPEVRAMGGGRDLFAKDSEGNEFPVEIGLAPLTIDGKPCVMATIVDITERKRAEEKLRNYSAKLELQSEILRNVHDAVFFVTNEGVIQNWNEGARRIFGITADIAVGKTIYDVCPHQSLHPFDTRIKPAVQKTGLAQEVLRCHMEDGEEIFVRARVTEMVQGESGGYVFCVSDITDRKRLETELVQISEEEQRKLGEDLHDDLCSQLSGIGCLTKVLEQQLQGGASDKSAELAATVSDLIATAGVRAREIAKGLVPSVLENQGLEDALRDLAEQNHKLFGVNCAVTVDRSVPIEALDPGICIQLYRIAQEAITNAARHSDADFIKVDLSLAADRIVLMVQDDGKGMSVDLVTAGMGLLTMSRRAELIDGDFSIEATPGKGTTIECRIPAVHV